MSGLRLLMTTDTIGGVFQYTLELCSWLGRRGSQVVLVTLGPEASAAQRAQLARIPGLQLVQLGGRLEWMDEPWQDVDAAGYRLLELARLHAVQLVHLNGFAHAALPFAVPKLLVAHSCVLSWWRAVHGCSAPAQYAEYQRRVRAGLRAAQLVVAPSASMLRSLSVEYELDLRGVVIPNAVDATRFAPAEKRPSVCAVGRFWDAGKNLEQLLGAARDLRWPVYLAGDLTAPDGRSAPDHGLAHVHSLGRLGADRLAALLASSAVYAHPARYEPFGLSVLEAALSGCALVLGDIPSLRELWQGAAHFVACDDEAGMRTCLERLLAAPQLRSTWGLRARTRALGCTVARFGAAYERQYGRLVRQALAERTSALESADIAPQLERA